MKKVFYTLALVVMMVFATGLVNAQVNPGVDIYSSYVWRGTKFGSGPAIQPYVDYTTGGFSVGAWGSVCTSSIEAYEMDLYAKYAFGFGLTLGVNDYYFGIPDSISGVYPGGDYFTSAAHYIEPTLSFAVGGFSVLGAYMLNAEDAYAELGYSIKNVSLFVGAGNGQYTSDAKFGVCNVGLKATESIKLTESYSLPINGQVILNPSKQSFHIVVGITL